MTLLREIKAIIGFLITHYPDTKFGLFMRNKYWNYVHGNAVKNATIHRGARIGLKNKVEIQENFALGQYATIAAGDSHGIYIGKDVAIAQNAYLRTANHEFRDRNTPIQQQGHTFQTIEFNNSKYSIVIEDDVWIGANSVILSGAHIGKGSIIGALTIVSSVIPPYSIVLGNPGRVIAKR